MKLKVRKSVSAKSKLTSTYVANYSRFVRMDKIYDLLSMFLSLFITPTLYLGNSLHLIVFGYAKNLAKRKMDNSLWAINIMLRIDIRVSYIYLKMLCTSIC